MRRKREDAAALVRAEGGAGELVRDSNAAHRRRRSGPPDADPHPLDDAKAGPRDELAGDETELDYAKLLA
jgi:hypothetical protein